MRLFAAVDPPESEISALAAALGHDERLRYVPTEQWHVTTAFYGEVAEDVLPDLVERLGRAASRSAPMTLRVAGIGTFPKQPAKARVLWAGLSGDVELLARLADRCVAAGRRCGLAMEERPYRPHLTVARARRDPVDLRDMTSALSAYAGADWHAATVRLVKSTLGSVVRHETLQEWPLGASG